MKFSGFLRTSAVVAAVVFAFSTAQAQSPDQQFGVGVSVSGSTAAGVSNVSSGLHVAYALNPGLHIGTGFDFGSLTTANKVTISTFGIAPYAKFLFMGPNATLKPFAQVGLSYSSIEGSATTDVGLFGGAEYFVNRNLGVFGGVTLLTFNLSDEEGGASPFKSGFGFLAAGVGVEWFF